MESAQSLEQDLHRWYKTFKAQLSRQERHGERAACLTCGKMATSTEPDTRGATVCSFFQAGTCKRGMKCKFAHGQEVPASAPPQPVVAVILTECEACESVVFCSPECQKAAETGPPDDLMSLKSHSELDCHELQLFEACKDIIDEEEMEKGEPQWLAYSDLVQSFLELTGSPGWSHYAELRGMPSFSPPFMALVTDALSFPLTLVYALGQCVSPPSPACAPAAVLLKEALTGGTLRIHLLGAEWESEGTGDDKWMEILQLLPKVQALELVLVGPSLPDECHGTTNQMCAMLADEKEGRPYTLAYWKGTYEAYMLEPDYATPHLAVAFHSGLADFREEWRPAITPLLNRGVPLLLTHYHRHEADFDCRTLRCHFQAHIVGGNFALNPYQSLLPIPDVFEGRVYYCNHFFTIAWGRIVTDGSGKRKSTEESATPALKTRGKLKKRVKVLSAPKPNKTPKR